GAAVAAAASLAMDPVYLSLQPDRPTSGQRAVRLDSGRSAGGPANRRPALCGRDRPESRAGPGTDSALGAASPAGFGEVIPLMRRIPMKNTRRRWLSAGSAVCLVLWA